MSGTWNDDALEGNEYPNCRTSASTSTSARMAGYALTKEEKEQACISIYLNLHVSQLSSVSEAIRESWDKGQSLYAQKHNGELTRLDAAGGQSGEPKANES